MKINFINIQSFTMAQEIDFAQAKTIVSPIDSTNQKSSGAGKSLPVIKLIWEGHQFLKAWEQSRKLKKSQKH